MQKVGPDAVVATASSAITISRIVPDGRNQARCLVAHPVNPPSVLRVIELVPAEGTTDQTMETAKQVFQAAGFATVALGHEIEGFVLNRLQGAVLREAYRLVEEGVTDVAGIGPYRVPSKQQSLIPRVVFAPMPTGWAPRINAWAKHAVKPWTGTTILLHGSLTNAARYCEMTRLQSASHGGRKRSPALWPEEIHF